MDGLVDRFGAVRDRLVDEHQLRKIEDRILEDEYGRELVEKGGLEVITTLDYSIQSLAEKVVQGEVNRLSRLNVTNGATLVLSPKTGEI